MARSFAAASSQYFGGQVPLVISAPLTISAWIKVSDLSVSGSIVTLGNTGTTHNAFELYFGSDGPSGTANFFCAQEGVGTGVALGPSTAINGTSVYYHVLCRANSSSSREVAVNGTFGTADTGVDLSPANINGLYIGAQRYNGATNLFFNGSIAEVGIWNTALSNQDVASLAAGFSPLMIAPQSLKHYVPLFGRATDEEDWMTGTNGPYTNNGSSTISSHPNLIIYPGVAEIIAKAAAAAAGTLKTAFGLARASIKTIDGLAIASVKTYDTLTP